MSFPLLLAVLSLPPGWSGVAQSPAAQAIVHGDAVVVISTDFLHVAALTMTGAPRWRTQYQTAAAGIQALQVRRDALLLFAGPKMTPLNIKTGKVGRWQSVPAIGTAKAPGCWLNESAGALGYMCPCSFQFAGQNAAPIGARYDYFRQCRRPYGGGPGKCGCWGSSGTLIGRAGGLLIASVPTPQPEGHRGKRIEWSQILVGVDAKTGRQVWRQPGPIGEPATYVNGAGLLPDSTGFWTADSRGQLTVFDAKTGQLRWQTAASTKTDGPSKNVWITPLGTGSIFVATHASATAFDTQTGAPQWQAMKGKDAVLPLSALDRSGGVSVRDAPAIRLVDDRTGAVLATMMLLGETAQIQRADGEIWMVRGTRLQRFTAVGRLLSEATVAKNSTLIRGETVVLANSGERLQALDAKTLAPLGTLDGRYEVLQLEGAAGARHMWVKAPDGMVRLLRMGAR